jgi:hypothetical protein
LARLPAGDGRTLVILVLNRPDSDSDPLANAELRCALPQSLLAQEHLPQERLPQAMRNAVPVCCLNPHTDLYLHDMELLRGPTPAALGVGLARKTGSDIALQWMAAGGIGGQWLCCTDADATLPPGYFAQLESAASGAVAAVFPFRHMPGDDAACNDATALYELRLHHYVLGLEYANSPYAFHTLGSCLAVRCAAYAHAHGFPKRAGAPARPVYRVAIAVLVPRAVWHRPCGGRDHGDRTRGRCGTVLPSSVLCGVGSGAGQFACAGRSARSRHCLAGAREK